MRSQRTRFVLATALGLSGAMVALATIAQAQTQQAPATTRRSAAPSTTGNRQAAVRPNGRGASPDGQMVEGRGGPGGRGGNAAGMILGMRQQLELTDDQVKKLETLRGAQPKSTATDQMRARADLMDAMQGEGNLSAARTALDKMARIRTDATIARLKERQDARAVLTATQRTKLDGARQRFAGQMMRQGIRQRIGQQMRNNRFGPQQFRGRQGFGPQQFRQGPMGGGMNGMGPGMAPGMRNRMGPGMDNNFGPGMIRQRVGPGMGGMMGPGGRGGDDMGPEAMGPEAMGPGGNRQGMQPPQGPDQMGPGMNRQGRPQGGPPQGGPPGPNGQGRGQPDSTGNGNRPDSTGTTGSPN